MKNLVFDYDGTLHETIRIYGPAFRKNYEILVSKRLMPERSFTDAEIACWLGFSAVDMWNTFAPGLPEEEKAASSYRIQEEMGRLIENGTARLYPGVPEILNSLKAAGCRIYLLSNCKTVYLERHRKHFQLDRWFDGYYWSEKENWIPKPGIMKKLLAEHPGPAVMIGDRFLDLEAGTKNGLPAIGCAYGYGTPEEMRAADLVAGTPQELPALIRKILPSSRRG